MFFVTLSFSSPSVTSSVLNVRSLGKVLWIPAGLIVVIVAVFSLFSSVFQIGLYLFCLVRNIQINSLILSSVPSILSWSPFHEFYMWLFFMSLISLLNIFLHFFNVFVCFSIFTIIYLSYYFVIFFKIFIWYFLSSRCSYLLLIFLFFILFGNFWLLEWWVIPNWNLDILDYECLWRECNTSLLPEWVQVQFPYSALLIPKGMKEGCRKGR